MGGVCASAENGQDEPEPLPESPITPLEPPPTPSQKERRLKPKKKKHAKLKRRGGSPGGEISRDDDSAGNPTPAQNPLDASVPLGESVPLEASAEEHPASKNTQTTPMNEADGRASATATTTGTATGGSFTDDSGAPLPLTDGTAAPHETFGFGGATPPPHMAALEYDRADSARGSLSSLADGGSMDPSPRDSVAGLHVVFQARRPE